MSFILPAVLQVIATQYVAFALPTPNTTSAAIETLLSSTLASCRDLYSCRSIVGLVWSCLTTFFLCTWVTIHPDVPSENKTSWSFNYIFDSRPRGGLLVLMLCAPELVVASAYDQWTNACRYVVRLSKQCPNVRWTETHGMMMMMSGFKVVKEDDPEKKRTNLKDFDASDFELYEIDFSTITEDDIMDKSKGDTIAKLLVVIQTSWFAIQCAARVSQGLPVTALELTTLGHTVFVVIIYFIWWHKPLDVRSPIILQAKLRKDCGADEVGRDSEEGEVSQGVKDVGESDRNSMESHTLPLMKTSTVNGPQNPYQLSWRIQLGIHVPDGEFESMGTSVKEWVLFTSLLVISSMFGTMHCLGWNSYFPSHVEQIFWRVAALTITAIPVVLLTLAGPLKFSVRKHAGFVVYVLPSLYICARISLITLAFLALRDLPPPAYQTPSWINFIPHL